MDATLENDNECIDSLLVEASLFLKFYLGKEVRSDELFKELILELPPFGHVDFVQKRSIFFRELEKLSIDKKSQIPGSKKKQLELFTQLPDQASFSSESNKEIGLGRARACINYWNRSGDSQVKEQALSGNEKMMEPLLQFSVKLFLQEFFAGEEKPTREDLKRHQRITCYLMDLLSDPEAVEVEKKCRQDPGWQRDKVWASKIMGWFETALKTVEADDDNDEVIPQIEIKSQLKSKFAHLSKDSSTEESPSIMQKDEGLSTEPVIATLGKDVGLRIYFAVGVLALLIGYFGWREHKETIGGRHDSKEKTVSPVKKTVHGDSQDFSYLAIISAEKSANSVLAEQTVATIKKMENEIEVPRQLLLKVPEKEADLLFSSSDSTVGPVLHQGQVIKESEIEEALAMDTGYLFRPGKESLGKITEVSYLEEKLFFKRADWPNPQASFALLVADYEVRLGSQEQGFLILGGEVRRQVVGVDSNSSLPVHYLIPVRAWWLDQNQTRTMIDPKLLKKRSNRVGQGQKHLKNR